LYVNYLRERLEVLMAGEEQGVGEAAEVARQLLKVLAGAHEKGGAGLELYRTWGEVAMTLQQPKVRWLGDGGLEGGGTGGKWDLGWKFFGEGKVMFTA
jgi:hypothetical protein